MEKDFDKWNKLKINLESKTQKYLFKEGDVWWSFVGLNIGTESCGKGENFRRPVLVFKKLSGNSFIGIPLSTQKKEGSWFLELNTRAGKSYALIYQIKKFHTNRLGKRMFVIDTDDFKRVKDSVKKLLDL